MTKGSNAFEAVDPLLDAWAARNGISWQREVKGEQVRSYSIPMGGSESVQLWLEPPSQTWTTVHVAMNSNFADRQRHEAISYKLNELEAALNDALRRLREWRVTYSRLAD